MASINSRPKSPAVQPAITYVSPVPVVESDPVKTEDELAEDSRTESLLRRSRGRFGTILTGFRGFLEATDNNKENSRKTLLGE